MLSHHAANYRPDVDGMRAVAVILVIANHFSEVLAPSGFVGVDMFFVISGFVVTRSILSFESPNAIADVGRFWRRRFFRIFPVLALMVLATLLLEAIFTPRFPYETYEGNTRTGLAALLGVGNLYLYRLGLDYFQNLSSNPFVHTWSLGVEEQFYLFYSLVFIGLARVFGRPREVKLARMLGLAVLGVLSFGLFIARAQTNPMETYYFLPTRFWELAAGGAISIAIDQFGLSVRPDAKYADVAQLAAFLLLVAGALWTTSPGEYPTLPIVGAVFGTTILIATGTARGALIARALEWPAFVYLGLISFSLYLWHFPILTLFRYTVGLDDGVKVIFALALIFGLSSFTYRFVETPWRAPANRRFPKIAPYLAGVLGGIVLINVGERISTGFLYAGERQAWASEWWPSRDYSYVTGAQVTANHCMINGGAAVPSQIPPGCASPPSASNFGKLPTVLTIGDSFGQSSWGMLAYGQKADKYALETLVHSGCAIDRPPNDQLPSCASYWAEMPSLIRHSVAAGDIVFVSILWSTAPEDIARSRLAEYASVTRQIGAWLVVQAPIPNFSTPAYFCTPEWFRITYSGCTTKRQDFETKYRRVNAMLQALGNQFPNLYIWNSTDLLCPDRDCSVFRGGKPLYRDQMHLSDYGARFLGPAFLTFLLDLHERRFAEGWP